MKRFGAIEVQYLSHAIDEAKRMCAEALRGGPFIWHGENYYLDVTEDYVVKVRGDRIEWRVDFVDGIPTEVAMRGFDD